MIAPPNVSDEPRAPAVSICIPSYNRPRQMREAIASVLSQTSTDLEVVVTDDAGRDQQVASEFADNRLRYYVNEHNLGMAGNWERALSLARGRFVGLLMDDDTLLPTFVERCLDVFDTQPRVGAVFTNHFFDDGLKVSARDRLLPEGPYPEFLPHILRHNPVAICATLMKREVWDQVLPLPNIHTADLVLQIRAAQAGCTFYYLDEPLMVYRVHQGQLSGSPHFRGHRVALWRLFNFDIGSDEEALRRRLLAEALLSCSAAHIQGGDFPAAARLAREAAGLGVTSSTLTRRARVIAALAKSGVSMRGTAWVLRAIAWGRGAGTRAQPRKDV